MHPILIKIGNFVIYTYGAMMALAFLVFSFYTMKFSKYFKVSKETVFDGILLGTLIAIFSSRLAWVIVNWQLFSTSLGDYTIFELIFRIFNVREGGLTIFGAIFTVPLFIFWLSRRRGENPFRLLDLYAFAAPWAISIGRLGCFLNGCCYGKPWDGPWAVIFPNLTPPLPRHPTQLYELIAMLITGILFLLILLRVLKEGKEIPRFFGWFLIAYSSVRFVVEFFREGSPIALFGLTAGQIASLALLALGIAYLLAPLESILNGRLLTLNSELNKNI